MSRRQSGLAKVLKNREVLMLSFGAMIGWSWVLMTGYWIDMGGSLGTVLAFAVGGLAILFIGLTYSELASAMPHAGGEHIYTHRALGLGASFVCTWALLMAYGTVCVFESVALPTALVYLFPGIRFHRLWEIMGAPVDLGFVIIGVGGALIMTIVNLLGIRTASLVQTVITLVILLAGAMLLSGAALFGQSANLTPALPNGLGGALVVLIMVPAMLVGFDVIPQSADEIDLPPQRIGLLLLVSVAMAVAWYGLISLAVASGLDGQARAGAQMASADAATALWGGSWAGTVLVVGGIGGILTSWNAFIIGGSRVMLALAEAGLLPDAFARIHGRYRTPYVGVMAIGAAACISPFFGRTILVWLINAGSFAVVIAYLMVAIAFVVLRRREPDMPRPFRVPAGAVLGPAAVVMAIGLLLIYLPWSPSALAWPEEWLLVLGWGVLGVVVWGTRRRASARNFGLRTATTNASAQPGAAARTDQS
jgi:amino acid transporter